MLDPSRATGEAPKNFKAKFETTAGDFVVDCTRSWAPHGVDRFYNLVRVGFYDDVAIFRVAPGFVAQWGIHGNPAVSKAWDAAQLPADDVGESNLAGTLSFAQDGDPAGKGKTAATRGTQVFLNLGDNDYLDAQGFAPICQVVEGLEVTTKLGGAAYAEHLKRAQGQIKQYGNELLRSTYPELDYIKKASIVFVAPPEIPKGKR